MTGVADDNLVALVKFLLNVASLAQKGRQVLLRILLLVVLLKAIIVVFHWRRRPDVVATEDDFKLLNFVEMLCLGSGHVKAAPFDGLPTEVSASGHGLNRIAPFPLLSVYQAVLNEVSVDVLLFVFVLGFFAFFKHSSVECTTFERFNVGIIILVVEPLPSQLLPNQVDVCFQFVACDPHITRQHVVVERHWLELVHWGQREVFGTRKVDWVAAVAYWKLIKHSDVRSCDQGVASPFKVVLLMRAETGAGMRTNAFEVLSQRAHLC